jgi:AraC-like DNA-binding protein
MTLLSADTRAATRRQNLSSCSFVTLPPSIALFQHPLTAVGGGGVHAKCFNTVVATLREELAEKYLKQSDLSLKEIAFLLGYTEFSSFNHAFKKWVATTSR